MIDVDPILLMFAGVAVSALCLGAVILAPRSPQALMRRRAQRVVTRARIRLSNDASAQTAADSIRSDDTGSRTGLDRIAARFLPRVSVLRERLARTGLAMSPGDYILASAVIAALSWVSAWLLLGLAPVVATLVAVAVGVGLPHMAVGILVGRCRKRFIANLPEAIDLIVRGLKSGLPVTASLVAVADEIVDPVGSEFQRIVYAVRFGTPLDEALWEVAIRLNIPEFKFFVISLAIQQETGGNLAETLANLSNILRRRRQLRLKIKALSGEARASAFILGSLPFVMLAIIYVVNQSYALTLFSDPRGQLMLGGAALEIMIGVAVMVKMVRFEV
jgi:tight adherence protein B